MSVRRCRTMLKPIRKLFQFNADLFSSERRAAAVRIYTYAYSICIILGQMFSSSTSDTHTLYIQMRTTSIARSPCTRVRQARIFIKLRGYTVDIRSCYTRSGTRYTSCRSIRGAAYGKQCAAARKSYARFTLVEPRRARARTHRPKGPRSSNEAKLLYCSS
ncbi:unnamed protein product [Trichogramma brassicae]|uniref:Uncharacterized protein n=1 Tax=Trichogramma brassicae TaxID=86971 RepID=A0A6H5J381_9HYME|nr:unnamed protein product [Trichogramma brassicae]